MQSRLGPTMVGPAGLLQPLADVLKLLQKEDIVPDRRRPAPLRPGAAARRALRLGAAAVDPVLARRSSRADLDIGVLFLLAIGGATVMPIFAAGWASNNKFALLGGMRAIAQSRLVRRAAACWRRWCR